MKLERCDRVATVGNSWSSEIVVGKDQKLYLIQEDQQILLGPATKARVEQILFNFKQIASVLS